MPLTTAILLSSLLVPGFPGCEDEPDPSRVPELIRMLGSKDSQVRYNAALQLEQIGPEAKLAVPRLVALLGDRTPHRIAVPLEFNIDLEAEKALTQIGVEAVPALVDALKSPDGKVVDGAARVLGNIGPRAKTALPPLIRGLDVADKNLRRTLIRSISRIDPSGESSLRILIDRLQDQSEDVRGEAADLLGQRGRAAEAAAPELLKALNDPKPRVRGAAARALAEIGADGHKALPILVELLKDRSGYNVGFADIVGWYPVAHDAAYALGIYGQSNAIPPLIEAVRDPESLPDAAAEALAAFGPRARDAVPVLLKALSDGEPCAASALVKIGVPKEALPRLKELLGSESRHVRIDAALVLCAVDPANTRDEPDIALAALDSDQLCDHVAQVLGDFGPAAQFAVLKLVASLQDKKGWLRWEVATALGKIGPAARPAGPVLISHLDWPWDYDVVTEALVGIGPAMVPLLVQELESKPESTDMRIGLLQTLAAFGPQADSAVPALVAALDDRCRSVRVAAAAALRHVRTSPERALPALTRALGDPRPAVRSESARSLGHYGLGAAPAVAPLAAALADEYLDVRLSAAEALARLGPTARPALPALHQAAESPNELLRNTARHAISRIQM